VSGCGCGVGEEDGAEMALQHRLTAQGARDEASNPSGELLRFKPSCDFLGIKSRKATGQGMVHPCTPARRSGDQPCHTLHHPEAQNPPRGTQDRQVCLFGSDEGFSPFLTAPLQGWR